MRATYCRGLGLYTDRAQSCRQNRVKTKFGSSGLQLQLPDQLQLSAGAAGSSYVAAWNCSTVSMQTVDKVVVMKPLQAKHMRAHSQHSLPVGLVGISQLMAAAAGLQSPSAAALCPQPYGLCLATQA